MIRRLNNVTVPLSDLNGLVEFYEKVLCLKKQFECPTYVIFDCGGVEIGKHESRWAKLLFERIFYRVVKLTKRNA